MFKKRKYFGNQHETGSQKSEHDKRSSNLNKSNETVCDRPRSSSFEKLGNFMTNSTEKCSDKLPTSYIVIDIDILNKNLFQSVVCSKCGVGKVSLQENVNNRMGCASSLELKCDKCLAQRYFMSSNLIENTGYDINIRLVYGLRSIGKGHDDAVMLCSVLDIPGPPTRFKQFNTAILKVVSDVAEKNMTDAVQEVIQKTDSSDIAAAIDGSWQKRGHTSINGVVTATAIETGKVIDVHCLSKYCHGCKLAKEDPTKIENHEQTCQLNYEGSSGGMEVKGAIAIFNRSQMNRGARYLTYLGDGDSKGYKAVTESLPYGPDVEIVKAECIGHVQKRMGARLRALCKSEKGKNSAIIRL